MGEQRQLLRADVTKLSKQHRHWLKRLATGKIPDAEWPLGFNSRGQLQVFEPGQPLPEPKIISGAEARERARRPLPLP